MKRCQNMRHEAQGSPTQLEARRRAVALLHSGLGVREVARRVGSSASDGRAVAGGGQTGGRQGVASEAAARTPGSPVGTTSGSSCWGCCSREPRHTDMERSCRRSPGGRRSSSAPSASTTIRRTCGRFCADAAGVRRSPSAGHRSATRTRSSAGGGDGGRI